MLISFAADAFRARLQSPRHYENICSCGYSSQRRLLLRLLVAKILALASIFPAVPSARAIPAEVVDSTPINRKCFSSKYLSKKVVGYFWRLLRKKRNERDPAGRAEDACVSSAEAKEIADHIFYIVQKMNPQIFILLINILLSTS